MLRDIILLDMETSMSSVGALTVLALGIMLGFKHATEVDHVVAVSSIVSQQHKIWRSAFIGLLWGVGHTTSLFIIGMLMLVFELTIPSSVSGWFELLVAGMIVVLGALGFVGAIRKRRQVHFHRHNHRGQSHSHVHFHQGSIGHSSGQGFHSHEVNHIGLKPLIVGSIHGLAGSAALTLLILPEIESVLLGLAYLLTFGLGSVAGMLLMSVVMGLPFALASSKLRSTNYAVQFVAGGASVIFGLWYAYQWSVS
jgi:cytochrome c biogenesis protein CcdA